jgi:uncharacterized protein (DUF427 family)
MKIPGPDHPITFEAAPRRVRAAFAGHVIADTDDAVILREASYRPVYYFPREGVEMSLMGRTDHHTHCPYKGDASYWTIAMDGRAAENVAWSYEDPFPAAMAVKDMIAFYPDRVEVYEVDGAEPAPTRPPSPATRPRSGP